MPTFSIPFNTFHTHYHYGEAFGDHGSEGHARDIYGEVTTTPFILSFPFRLEPGLVVDSRTANVDLWQTVLELTGMPPLEETDGRPRLPEIVATALSSGQSKQAVLNSNALPEDLQHLIRDAKTRKRLILLHFTGPD